MPGTVVKVVVEKGEKVEKGDQLMITEAMKMETTVQAPFSGVVKDIFARKWRCHSNRRLVNRIRKVE